MYPIAIAAILFWAGYLASGLTRQNNDVFDMLRMRTRQVEMVNMAEGLAMFYEEQSGFPASLTALTAMPGYEYLSTSLNNWQGYVVSPSITDSKWTFNRMVAFSYNPAKSVSQATYVASNACGTGDASTASSWCGDSTSQWFRSETRESFSSRMGTQRARFNRLLHKFANYYNGMAILPNQTNASVALTAGNIYKLTTLTGYAGTAANCTGQYQFQGVPIDCSDMYDLWGSEVGYQYVSDTHIIMVSEPPVFDNNGNRVVVAADFNIM